MPSACFDDNDNDCLSSSCKYSPLGLGGDGNLSRDHEVVQRRLKVSRKYLESLREAKKKKKKKLYKL